MEVKHQGEDFVKITEHLSMGAVPRRSNETLVCSGATHTPCEERSCSSDAQLDPPVENSSQIPDTSFQRTVLDGLATSLAILCFIIFLLVVCWVSIVASRKSSFKDAIGYLHYMSGVVTCFVLFPIGAISFRFFTTWPRSNVKVVHSLFMGLVTGFAIAALAIMCYLKESKKVPHFKTLHSWVAIFVVTIMFLQFLVALITFYFDFVPLRWKLILRDIHVHIGCSLVVFMLATAFLAFGYLNKLIMTAPFDERILAYCTALGSLLVCSLTLFLLTNHTYKRPNIKSS